MDTTYIDNFVNECLLDFINGKYDYNYGEDIAIGGLKVISRRGNNCSVMIQFAGPFFSIIVNQDSSHYLYYSCLTSSTKPFQNYGPVEKFMDTIVSLIVLKCLEAM